MFGVVDSRWVLILLNLVDVLNEKLLLSRIILKSIDGIELFQYSVPNKNAFLIVLPGAIWTFKVSLPPAIRVENPAPVTPQ
jgi:hypothetical protein